MLIHTSQVIPIENKIDSISELKYKPKKAKRKCTELYIPSQDEEHLI